MLSSTSRNSNTYHFETQRVTDQILYILVDEPLQHSQIVEQLEILFGTHFGSPKSYYKRYNHLLQEGLILKEKSLSSRYYEYKITPTGKEHLSAWFPAFAEFISSKTDQIPSDRTLHPHSKPKIQTRTNRITNEIPKIKDPMELTQSQPKNSDIYSSIYDIFKQLLQVAQNAPISNSNTDFMNRQHAIIYEHPQNKSLSEIGLDLKNAEALESERDLEDEDDEGFTYTDYQELDALQNEVNFEEKTDITKIKKPANLTQLETTEPIQENREHEIKTSTPEEIKLDKNESIQNIQEILEREQEIQLIRQREEEEERENKIFLTELYGESKSFIELWYQHSQNSNHHSELLEFIAMKSENSGDFISWIYKQSEGTSGDIFPENEELRELFSYYLLENRSLEQYSEIFLHPTINIHIQQQIKQKMVDKNELVAFFICTIGDIHPDSKNIHQNECLLEIGNEILKDPILQQQYLEQILNQKTTININTNITEFKNFIPFINSAIISTINRQELAKKHFEKLSSKNWNRNSVQTIAKYLFTPQEMIEFVLLGLPATMKSIGFYLLESAIFKLINNDFPLNEVVGTTQEEFQEVIHQYLTMALENHSYRQALSLLQIIEQKEHQLDQPMQSAQFQMLINLGQFDQVEKTIIDQNLLKQKLNASLDYLIFENYYINHKTANYRNEKKADSLWKSVAFFVAETLDHKNPVRMDFQTHFGLELEEVHPELRRATKTGFISLYIQYLPQSQFLQIMTPILIRWIEKWEPDMRNKITEICKIWIQLPIRVEQWQISLEILDTLIQHESEQTERKKYEYYYQTIQNTIKDLSVHSKFESTS